MKTLEEVYKEAGEKFPFTAKHNRANPSIFQTFVCKMPDSHWLSYDNNCNPNVWGEMSDAPGWSLYTPPKPTVKMYQALFKNGKGVFYLHERLFVDEEQARNASEGTHRFISLITSNPIEVPCE